MTVVPFVILLLPYLQKDLKVCREGTNPISHKTLSFLLFWGLTLRSDTNIARIAFHSFIHSFILSQNQKPPHYQTVKAKAFSLTNCKPKPMKLFAILCAIYSLAATAKGSVFSKKDNENVPRRRGPPPHVLDKFREKFGVRKGFELRK